MTMPTQPNFDEAAARFKPAADKVIAKYRGQYPSRTICRRIEIRLRDAINTDFPELRGFTPTVTFKDGTPRVFLVQVANANIQTR